MHSLPGHQQLKRLIILRWFAIAAQLLVIFTVQQVLQLELPLTPMLLTVTMLAAINILSGLRQRHSRLVSNVELFCQMCADVLALSVLLYYSGGSTNPFISLFLLPLVIAATTLPGRYTWSMAALTATCYGVLIFNSLPLPHNHHNHTAFDTHMLGMQLGFVISALVIAYFVVQMSQAMRQRDEMLARVREDVLRNERIVALGTQAAGAAHELGTPLSTMSVIIGEMRHELPAEWQSNITILDEQIRGCKRILQKVLANAQAQPPQTQAVDDFMRELLDEWQLLRPTALYQHHLATGSPPNIFVDATLRAALMNLLNNATDASAQALQIYSRWDDRVYTLEIQDFGPGLSEDIAAQAGSAFFTTKSAGHGLGLFLANATIERLGGSVRLYNRDHGGATTDITLPIAQA